MFNNQINMFESVYEETDFVTDVISDKCLNLEKHFEMSSGDYSEFLKYVLESLSTANKNFRFTCTDERVITEAEAIYDKYPKCYLERRTGENLLCTEIGKELGFWLAATYSDLSVNKTQTIYFINETHRILTKFAEEFQEESKKAA